MGREAPHYLAQPVPLYADTQGNFVAIDNLQGNLHGIHGFLPYLVWAWSGLGLGLVWAQEVVALRVHSKVDRQHYGYLLWMS